MMSCDASGCMLLPSRRVTCSRQASEPRKEVWGTQESEQNASTAAGRTARDRAARGSVSGDARRCVRCARRARHAASDGIASSKQQSTGQGSRRREQAPAARACVINLPAPARVLSPTPRRTSPASLGARSSMVGASMHLQAGGRRRVEQGPEDCVASLAAVRVCVHESGVFAAKGPSARAGQRAPHPVRTLPCPPRAPLNRRQGRARSRAGTAVPRAGLAGGRETVVVLRRTWRRGRGFRRRGRPAPRPRAPPPAGRHPAPAARHASPHS